MRRGECEFGVGVAMRLSERAVGTEASWRRGALSRGHE